MKIRCKTENLSNFIDEDIEISSDESDQVVSDEEVSDKQDFDKKMN